jgi:1-acyl-sn-glycerol-3-phosphate acyltransferase
MSYETFILLGGGFMALALVSALGIVSLARRLRAYVDKVSACGYLHHPPTRAALFCLRLVARFATFIQVGRIKVNGSQNLPGGEPLLVACNHPSHIDPAVIALVLRRPLRFLAARRFFRFCFGLPSLACAPCGAISVDLRRGRGRPAHDASVKVLTSGQTLMMFPEGYAYLDGKLGPFRKGAPRIAREAAAKLGKPVYILPVCIRYGRSPGSWIRKWNEPNQYLWVFLNFWYYRRGATVTIGKPISTAELPAGDTEAADYLAARIAALDPAGELKPLPSGVGLPYPPDSQEL